MHQDISKYNDIQIETNNVICDHLAKTIMQALPEAENKLWHGHPVWFDAGNPIVGYSVGNNKKVGTYVRLMFWGGADFAEPALELGSGKFKDAHIDYTRPEQIDAKAVSRWCQKALDIQWDYKNIIRHKGLLKRLK